jgi:hypothetical protein
MQVCRLLVLCGLALAVCCASIEAGAATVPPLTVRATNVTMPSVTVVKTSGGATSARMGSSQVKVTGIPDAGTLTIECQYSGPIVKAKIPRQCGPVGLPGIPVTAGQIYTGSVIFVPYDQGIVPGLSQLRRTPAVSGRLTAATLGLAGALMFGFGFRHNKLRSLALAIFVVCVLAGALESSASGRKSDPMTRGTYQYTISANFKSKSDAALGHSVSTNITLTVR